MPVKWYDRAAKVLGWRWSHAHGGYINENHRNGESWADYVVAETAEDACFYDGIENETQAMGVVANAGDT